MNLKATYNTHISALSSQLLVLIVMFFLSFQVFSHTEYKNGNSEIKNLKYNNSPLVRLRVCNTQTPLYGDETVIYFDSLATFGFDKALDAYKLMNNAAGVPNLYSIMNQKLRLSINSLPIDWDTSKIVPLGLGTDATAEYNITATVIQNIPSDIQIYLVDSANGVIQNLIENSSYTFSFTKGFSESRFYLKFLSGRKLLTDVSIPRTHFSQFPTILVRGNEFSISNINNPEKADIYICNSVGQIVLKAKINPFDIQKFYIKKGIYILRIFSQDKAYSKKFIVQ
jgi:trimeric autotransporter adhesin